MAAAVIERYISLLAHDMYTIDPSTGIQEYASVMTILRKHANGLSEPVIRNEMAANFPYLKTDSLRNVLKELVKAEEIKEDGGKYTLTASGFGNSDYFGAASESVAMPGGEKLSREEILNPDSQRFWRSIRSYRGKPLAFCSRI